MFSIYVTPQAAFGHNNLLLPVSAALKTNQGMLGAWGLLPPLCSRKLLPPCCRNLGREGKSSASVGGIAVNPQKGDVHKKRVFSYSRDTQLPRKTEPP